MDENQCQGWRRYGGAFTMGRPIWEQCKEPATVVLTVRQDDRRQEMPACATCWQEAIDRGIEVLDAWPIAGVITSVAAAEPPTA